MIGVIQHNKIFEFKDEYDLADCLQTNSANINGEIVQIIE